MPAQHAKRINAGGIVHPTVLIDGRAVGTWKSERKKDHLDIVVELFDRLAPAVLAGVEAEVNDVGRFLGVKAGLRM